MANHLPRTPTVSRRQEHDVPQDDLNQSQQLGAFNSHNVDQNAGISLYDMPHSGVTFRSQTIAPSPPAHNLSTSPSKPSSLSTVQTPASQSIDNSTLFPAPLHTGLRLQTDIPGCSLGQAADSTSIKSRKSSEFFRPSKPIGVPLQRTPSLKAALANSVGSNSNFGSAPNSTVSSPMLTGVADITPLPSPLMSSDSPGPWKKLAARETSREFRLAGGEDSALVTASGESVSVALLNQSKRKAYHGLVMNASDSTLQDIAKTGPSHERNRSLSEYIPDAVQAPKPRQHAVSGSHVIPADHGPESPTKELQMRREPNLATKRGIAPVARPPTPPSSRTGGEGSDSDSSLSNAKSFLRTPKKTEYVYYNARTPGDNKRRRWRSLKLLGEGTFSKVMLATSQAAEEDRIDENGILGGETSDLAQAHMDRKKLVAVKICEHGPKGGASEERVEMSLKRELEIMKSISHPSLVHLIAWNIEETRAILVLSYCPGGDLFDVASQNSQLLVPGLLRRMLAELVAAIQFLHDRHIVHRDIKLENVLVNLPQQELAQERDWSTYPYSVVTLTDLGLSRRVADDEKLTTRCGSDDYAAPEVIMGQPYEGRAVDAWSLGVLLYALLESRLPFDPSPGMAEGHKQRSKTSHRIARVEWCWVKYAGEDGDHDSDEAKFEAAGLKGAMEITEGLLKRARSRWAIPKVAATPFVRDAIVVEGGIRFREEDTPEEVGAAEGV